MVSHTKNMIKLTKKGFGANVIIGIIGNTKDEVEHCFNGIYNFNGCPSFTELDWIQDNENGEEFVAAFQTNEERLIQAFYNQNINKLVYPTKMFNGKTIKAMAMNDAVLMFESIGESPILKNISMIAADESE